MNRLFPALILVIYGLASCSAPASPAPTGMPTLVATFTPLPPSSNPTKTMTLTPTLAVFSDTLGLTSDFADRLNGEGINSTISGEKGNWTISQVISGWNDDGTAVYEQNVNVVSLSSDAKAIHNASYPDGILTGTDSQGKTVFWSEEEKAWVRPLEISNDIEKPTFYPWGKQHLAIETCLLNPALNAPFSNEAVKNFKKSPGWMMQFGIDTSTNSSYVYLVPNSSDSIRWALDKAGKPIWFTTTVPAGTKLEDGTILDHPLVFESVLVQLLNPIDPNNPNADGTTFVLASAGEWWDDFFTGADANYRAVFDEQYIQGGNPEIPQPFYKSTLPQIGLAQKNNLFLHNKWGGFGGRPSLDSLLSLKGNELGDLIFPAYNHAYKFSDFYPEGFDGALKDPSKTYHRYVGSSNPDGSVAWFPLPADFQKLLYGLSFTTK